MNKNLISSQYYIYTLDDPITGEVRYVGKTTDLKERFKNHTNKCRDKDTLKRNWINDLKSKGLKPTLTVIDIVESEGSFWEKYWISQMIQWGFELTNSSSEGKFGNQTSFKKGSKPWNTGVPASQYERERLRLLAVGRISVRRREVSCYKLDDTFVEKYASVSIAAESVKGQASHITNCCKGVRNIHKGFKWKYS